jgi:hypothetical protein
VQFALPHDVPWLWQTYAQKSRQLSTESVEKERVNLIYLGNCSGRQNSAVRIQNDPCIGIKKLAAKTGEPFATPQSHQIWLLEPYADI